MAKWKTTLPRDKPDNGKAHFVLGVHNGHRRYELEGQASEDQVQAATTALSGQTGWVDDVASTIDRLRHQLNKAQIREVVLAGMEGRPADLAKFCDPGHVSPETLAERRRAHNTGCLWWRCPTGQSEHDLAWTLTALDLSFGCDDDLLRRPHMEYHIGLTKPKET